MEISCLKTIQSSTLNWTPFWEWSGLRLSDRTLIVTLLKSIIRMSGSMLFTLQSSCCAIYCCLYSMRTCAFWTPMKGIPANYRTPKEERNYLHLKPACEDALLQIQRRAISDNFLRNISNLWNHVRLCRSGVQRVVVRMCCLVNSVWCCTCNTYSGSLCFSTGSTLSIITEGKKVRVEALSCVLKDAC